MAVWNGWARNLATCTTKLLSDNGIDVLSTDRTKVSLEDYYFDLIGGGEDA